MVRRLLATLPLVGLLVLGLALTAQAHAFIGTGDCDGWTLQLDGTWGAYDITVDGTSIGLAQTASILDPSDDESRTFEVRWWKRGPDVTRTLTVDRVLDCTPTEETTTTTTPGETSTVPEEETTTSTTDPTTTTTTEATTTTQPTEESSTTTIPPTTTVPSTTSSSTPTSTTIPAETTTAPTPASFQATGSCDDGVSTITVDFDPAEFSQIDVYLGEPLGTPDSIITTPGGFVWGVLDHDTLFTLVGEGDGYTVPVSLFVEACTVADDPISSTTSTSTVELEVLPFTGSGYGNLVIAGIALLSVGGALIRGFRCEPGE